jgi:SAM-dependent methyltransferase
MSDLHDKYEEYYREPSAEFTSWRDLGAVHKSEHILQLLNGRSIESLIEIGCGDGAVLAHIRKARPDLRLVGYDIAESAAKLARGRGLDGIEVFDGVRIPRDDRTFDVAVLSHVLEHVPDPVATLKEAARVATIVVGEVPLEDTLLSFRTSYLPIAQELGHLQKFSLETARWLIDRSGMRVEADIVSNRDRDVRTYSSRTRLSKIQGNAKYLIANALQRASPRLWRLILTSDYTFLCVGKDATHVRDK